MLVRSWIDVLKSHFSRTPTRQDRRASGQRGTTSRRLRLETLEDRCLLAFLPAASYPAGASPQAIVTADFNGGGADIAVANYLSSTVSVMLGDGLGGLGAKTDFATGAYPQSLVVGDVSRDGQVDLVTANAADVSILRRDGAGSFAPRDSIGLPGQFPSGYGGTDPLV